MWLALEVKLSNFCIPGEKGEGLTIWYLCGRAFMESHLPAFKEKNSQLEVVSELIRGQHPHLKAFYSKDDSFLSRYLYIRGQYPILHTLISVPFCKKEKTLKNVLRPIMNFCY